MVDLLPEQTVLWQQVEAVARAQFRRAAVQEIRTPILEVTEPGAGIEVVASYRPEDTLLSGWAIGEERLAGKAGAVSARVGKGRVVLYGIDATYRGQPLGTAKMFFQGILTAAVAGAGR